MKNPITRIRAVLETLSGASSGIAAASEGLSPEAKAMISSRGDGRNLVYAKKGPGRVAVWSPGRKRLRIDNELRAHDAAVMKRFNAQQETELLIYAGQADVILQHTVQVIPVEPRSPSTMDKINALLGSK